MNLMINSSAEAELEKPKYSDVLSVQDVRKILGISRISVYKLIESHQVSAICIGRTYMIPKDAVREFLRENHYERRNHK